MSQIPKEFICPITLNIMKDPVIMSDGQTYEKSAIEKALSISPLSPLTKQPLSMKDAKPNYALKSLIENFLKIGKIPEMPTNTAKIDKNSKPEIESFKTEVIENPQNDKEVFVNMTITPKKIESRKPILLISLIDVSGSMLSSASNELKGNEEANFTRLSLVKHSLKTVTSTLSNDDLMCLITFNSKAVMKLEATKTDEQGKKEIFTKIENMKASGSTNIWDALRLGILVSQRYNNYSTCLMLFTDGEPNINPPMGIVPSLKEVISDIPNVDFTISTFAFGYQVDSKLMEEISKIGNGIYGYCPDCTMVGTIFVNFMSNILTTIESTIKIEVKNQNQNFNKIFEIGGLYSGISRHQGFYLDKNDFKNTEINLYLGKEKKKSINGIDLTEKNDDIMDQYFRFRLIKILEEIIESNNKNNENSFQKVKLLFDEINKIEKKTEFMKNLLIDLIDDDANHGQVEKAIKEEYYKKWGLNYLLSFLRFHIVEQCGNFKDQSLKFYSNEDFEKMQKNGNKIFISLPAPENDYDKGSNISQTNFTQLCYNAYGGCFTGNAFVEMNKGNKKKVKDLRKGDILLNGAEVLCVVENKINKVENVVCINDVCFSLYHPIEIKGKWVFPCQYFKVEKKFIDSWFNLVLKNKHEIELNGIKAITLGHNRTEGILKHPYFGTKKVIEALMKYDTYKKGYIHTSNLKVVRKNNLIDEYY
jgi:Mg-chelatase subunit ChlD